MEEPINNVTLSFLCSEDWNSFKITEGEHHCDKCSLAVKVFTNGTIEDLQTALKNPNAHVCGRFKKSQLNAGFLKYAAAIVVASSLSACTEEPVLTTQRPSPVEEELPEESFLGLVVSYDATSDTFESDSLHTKNQ